ncbi:MAG: acyl-CoA dehydrogenase family protein [bacterium]
MNQAENIIHQAKEFADKNIRPFAAQFELEEKIPPSLIKKMAERGYLAAPFPKEYCGLGLNPVSYGIFTEEIGKADSCTRVLLTVHTSLVGETLLRWGSEEQKKKYIPSMAKGETIAAFGLTEPEVGSDAGNIQTSYYKKNDKFIINGRKKWISLGDIADLILVAASNDGKVSTFLVERKFGGVTTKPIKGLLAGKATHIAEIGLNNVEVPEENLLGKLGEGFAYIINTALDYGRYSIAWAGVAIAQAAIEQMVTYARTRSQFGKKLCNFQLIQGIIADAITKVHAARALCLRAGQLRENKDKDAIMETTIAKYFTSKIAMQVTTEAVQVLGGNGCYNKYPVERLFREAKVLEIIEGTSQIQQEIISRYGLRKYYKPSLKV